MAAAAPIAISAGINAASSIVGALLAGHVARLKGAKSENEAIPQVVSAFDADVQQIVAAYNNGSISGAQAVQVLQTVDAGIVSYLRKQVGPPGTAWSDTSGFAGKCDKTCTAGCCVYYGDLGPVISGLEIAMGGSGRWGVNDPRLSASTTGVTVQVPQVFASKYGGVNRPGYTLTVVRRPGTSANPPQYAQTGLPPTPVPLGNVSNGTVQGQTTSFSVSSQGMLANAAVLANPLALSQQSSNGGALLIGLGAIAAVITIVLALKK